MTPGDLEGAAAGGGVWTAAGMAAVAVVIGAYRGLRGIKADSRQDTTVADLDTRLKAEQARADVMMKRADAFAAERNLVVAENAKLQATLEGFLKRLDALEAAVKAKDEKIADLEREVQGLEAAYDILVEEAAMTTVLLQQSGYEDIIEKVQAMHRERQKAIRLLDAKKHPCAPAEQLHENAARAKRTRLSGNAAPLKEPKT